MEEQPILNAHNKDEFPPTLTECLDSIKNPVYSSFFANNTFISELKLFPSIWKGEDSHNSLCLKSRETDKKEIPNILINTFGIEEVDLFRTKYEEAISGDGQEWKRITTLHSSSLLALLCFYSVTINHKLTIGNYEFTESFFEVKTQVYEDSKSNMDVVLRGKEKNSGKKVVLFLECKFSEYFNCGKYEGISLKAYHDTYKRLGLFENCVIPHVEFIVDSQNILIRPIDNKKNPIYCGGIKQMLSHYIGVSNYASERCNALATHNHFREDKDEIVLLGEILFDFQNTTIPKSNIKLDNYKTAYKKLALIINKEQKVKMLDEILTYQTLFDGNRFIKEDNIRKFYNFN